MSRKKITIVGAGFVGSTAAHWIAERGLGDVVLIDINGDAARGKALDLFQSMSVVESDAKVIGTDNYEDTKNSDIVVITAGIPRKPGMSRDDLIATNKKIMEDVIANVKTTSPNAILIIVSNPLDAMVEVAFRASGFPKARVIGMAGVLDSARMKTFVAMEAGCSVRDVEAFVLGGHGDTMVPIMRLAKVRGKPITEILSQEKIDAIVERTKNGGAEIVQYLKTGSAYFAPGASVMEMVQAIVNDEKKTLPCAARLEGEYGVDGLFIGVLAELGIAGVERVIEIDLTPEERTLFEKTVAHVKELMQQI
ncbi:MAG: malate dehydrogenase [Patescibacteria group bacterium]